MPKNNAINAGDIFNKLVHSNKQQHHFFDSNCSKMMVVLFVPGMCSVANNVGGIQRVASEPQATNIARAFSAGRPATRCSTACAMLPPRAAGLP
jgi:hypothetical protein